MADNVIPYGYSMDITQLGQGYKAGESDYVSWRDADTRKDKSSLDFNDMLLLMVTQFQNQTIDNQADTNDMMNQLIQMTVMQAITKVSTQVDELTTANVMGYAASLVDKWVTLGVYDENGIVTEKYGIVEATGTYNGMPVIFVDGQSYFLSSIMGVGKLPPLENGDSTEGAEDAVTKKTLEDGTTITVRENKGDDGSVVSREVTIDIPASDGKDAVQTVISTNGKVAVNEKNGNVTIDATGEGGYVTVKTGEGTSRYEDSAITVSPSGEVIEATTRTTLKDGTTITVRENNDNGATSREVTIVPASGDQTVIRTNGTVRVIEEEEAGYVACYVTGEDGYVTVKTGEGSEMTYPYSVTVSLSGEATRIVED